MGTYGVVELSCEMVTYLQLEDYHQIIMGTLP